jgi:hypothetical protein
MMPLSFSPGPRVLAVLAVLLLQSNTRAEDAAWKWQDALVPDLGFDLDAAQVVRVTSLNAKGAGTLDEALKTKGPRIVVFDVGGVIDLGMKGLDIREPQVVIAGQTAPKPGITVIRGGMRIMADQTLVQHLCVRPGDAGQAKRSGWSPDGISTAGGPVDVWIDHCSATWALDEQISASTYKSPTGEPARRIFIRDCIIAEGLNDASHEKGPHSKGTLVFGGTQHVAIVGNLFSSNVERNPVFQAGNSGVVVNNVIANPGQRAVHAHSANAESPNFPNARIAVVGNVVLWGEKSKRNGGVFEGVAEAFVKGNEGFDWLGESIPEIRPPSVATLTDPPVWPDGLKARSTTGALWHVARFVGARPAERDAIDERIVREALIGTARIIDSQDEVGGYPKHEPTARKLEVPATGRREWLEGIAREVTFGTAASDAKPAK